jgi:hapalindole H/12-epi-hapalindole U/12-epi-fischerindole U synthase
MTSSTRLASALVGVGLCLAGASHAAPVPITNASFEDDVVIQGAYQVLVPNGWSVYDPGGAIDIVHTAVGAIHPLLGHGFFPLGAPDGNQAALVSLGPDGPAVTPAGLEQTLAASLLPNSLYTLSVWVGNIGSGVSLPGSSDGGGVFYDLHGFPGYRVELWAGENLLAADDNALGGFIPEGEFLRSEFQFASGVAPIGLGESLKIRLINLNEESADPDPEGGRFHGIEVDFDDVRLDVVTRGEPVPEPATASLILLGLAGLARLRRRGGACV